MNVCIIGDGLTSLSLAQNLVNKKISVHIYYKKKINHSSLKRTLGISKDNFEFFKKEIMDIQKNFWEIKKIEVYSEKLKKDKILNFEKNKSNLFFMLNNDELYKALSNKLSKNNFFRKKLIKDDDFYQKLLEEKKYNLIINCDSKNPIIKKYFSKTINKTYNNFAYTTSLEHEELENNTAVQIFTKYGPIAYLPLSKTKTSVVYSVDFNKEKFSETKIINLIKEYNLKYLIKKIDKLNKFELKSSNLRNYFHNNILAFGDCLHKIHPLAGQGFNMTIRDIKVISKIIQNRIDLGIELEPSIFKEFENKTKHLNFLFSSGVDYIFEIFNFNKKIKNQNLNKILKFFGNNKILNKMIVKFADKGVSI